MEIMPNFSQISQISRKCPNQNFLSNRSLNIPNLRGLAFFCPNWQPCMQTTTGTQKITFVDVTSQSKSKIQTSQCNVRIQQRHLFLLRYLLSVFIASVVNSVATFFQTNKPNKALKTSQNKPRVFKISHENKPYKNTLTN